MKKIILIFIFVLMATLSFARLNELSVCGIKMGTEKEEAKRILRDRFGYLSVEEDAGNISVYDGSVGGISHKFMTFIFTWIDGRSMFNGAIFSTPYEINQQKDAIEHRELLKSVYEKKYDIDSYTNEDGFKTYRFGKEMELYGVITTKKAKGKDGKLRIYTDVYYWGPYDETSDI